ncbi:unnamed protein product [Miscanthus lutarioriparius]|uniref:Plant heme peroxidase family profile domain-containing protein n=1 Tax=Miscanthus lutarioriparius TaxID=422564 RepID=A0A811QX73_9POAL|nr:unnamed protein product [Miscanthus lutarioriparius]
MARRQWSSSGCGLAVAMLAVLSSVLCSGHQVPGGGFPLQPHFYDHACPQMQAIVGSIVAKSHAEDPRMAASLLRLHFHDCFCTRSGVLRSCFVILSCMGSPACSALLPGPCCALLFGLLFSGVCFSVNSGELSKNFYELVWNCDEFACVKLAL